MHKLYTALLVLLLANSLHASDELRYPCPPAANGVHQTIVLVNDQEYERIVPPELKQLLTLPKMEHKIIGVSPLLKFTAKGVQRLYREVPVHYGTVVYENGIGDIPFVVTRNLCECVGLMIVLPGRMSGLAHVSFEGKRRDMLKEFLAKFPQNQRLQCRVRLLTGYLTVLMREVYDEVIQAGFNVDSVDIPEYYLNCINRTSDGDKYIPYSRMGLSRGDIKKLKKLNSKVLENLMEARAPLIPDSAENPRIMMLDLRTGESCQFFERGFFSLNSDLFEYIEVIFKLFGQCGIHASMHEEKFRESVEKFFKSKMLFLRKTNAMCLNSMDLPFGASYWKEDPKLDKLFLMQEPEGK